MTKKSRREFLRDVAKLGVVYAGAAIVPASLEDILDVNNLQAQDRPPAPNGEGGAPRPAAAGSTTESLRFDIALRNYQTDTILGAINRTEVGLATLNATHTQSRYSIQISSNIDVHGSWVRMRSNLSGRFSHVDGTPNFESQYYWLRYQEGGIGTTPKLFVSDIHFDFAAHTSQSYGYHRQNRRMRVRYGRERARLSSPFHPSTRDLISAMMQARFLPQEHRQLNTIIEGVPRALWLNYQRPSSISRGSVRYPTHKYRLHFPVGILPDTSWDLYFHIHDAPNRTPLKAQLVKSDGSQIIFTIQNPSTSIPSTNLYSAR